jgi:peptidoglycan/xylan/chitin deacetylase (PgdA/CDA1 family)
VTGLLRLAALGLLGQPWLARVLALGTGPRCVILMLHRFRTSDGDGSGHDPAQLRDLLIGLRRNQVALVDVDAAIHAMRGEGSSEPFPRRSIAFTVDDGYADLVESGAPVFSEFDCPVTGYVVPGVIDGNCWFWWDQVDWIMRETQVTSLSVELQQQQITVAWSDSASRQLEQNRLIARLKTAEHSALLQFVDAFARAAGVPIAIPAPARYRVLSWDELRAAERRGMRFGAHSMTHPILSRCSAAQSAYEIGESVRRVNQELTNPSKVFCYPNGRADDFGLREMESVREAGLDAAVSSAPGVLRDRGHRAHDPHRQLAVPRFSAVEHIGHITRIFLG